MAPTDIKNHKIIKLMPSLIYNVTCDAVFSNAIHLVFSEWVWSNQSCKYQSIYIQNIHVNDVKQLIEQQFIHDELLSVFNTTNDGLLFVSTQVLHALLSDKIPRGMCISVKHLGEFTHIYSHNYLVFGSLSVLNTLYLMLILWCFWCSV